MKEIDVGQTVGGKYALLRLIGAGAMGQVWIARHEALQQTFAIKVMIPPASESAVQGHETAETSMKRFENEARIAANLSRKSRHIAAVTDYGVDDDVAYLVMELLQGEGLEQRIGDGSRLAPAEVSTVVTQIAKGLAVAHAEGVMHRDLKPANVFLTHDEEGALVVKVLDFGIARMGSTPKARTPTRLTMKGLVLGSPGYMSPEQAMAESPDTRSDVWSLAVVAFEALAGVTPFHSSDADQTILRICNFQATPLKTVMPNASDELAAIFVRAFSPKVDERFQNAPDFAATLAAALPPPVKRLDAARAATTARKAVSVPTLAEADVSLRVPMRPRKVLTAVGVGTATGLAIALLIVAGRSVLAPAAAGADARQLPSASVSPSVASALLPVPPPPPVQSVTTVSPAKAAEPRVHVTAPLKHVEPPPPATPAPTQTTAPAPSKSVDRSEVFWTPAPRAVYSLEW